MNMGTQKLCYKELIVLKKLVKYFPRDERWTASKIGKGIKVRVG